MESYKEIFKSKLDWANVFVRTNNFPLDRSSIFGSYEDALKYAKGDGSDSRKLGKTSYVGQTISVYENGMVSVYKIIGKDKFDPTTKTIEILERGLEELISKTDVEILIHNSILSKDFFEKVQDIINSEEINSKKVINDEKIQIIGTPLAQLINPTNDTDVYLNENNMFDVLKSLLFKELYPSNIVFTEGTIEADTKSPSIKANYKKGSVVEVGTECVFDDIIAPSVDYVTTDRMIENIEYGYSLSNNNIQEVNETKIVKKALNKTILDGNYILSVSYDNFINATNNEVNNTNKDNCVLTNHSVYVNDGQNVMTVSYEAPQVTATFDEIPTIYPCSNVRNTSNEHKIEEKQVYFAISNNKSLSSAEFNIYGAWYLYAGGSVESFIANSDSVRSLVKRNLTSKGTIDIEEKQSCESVVIAFPDTWGKLQKVKDNGSNTFITNNFTLTNVNVKGANNYGVNNYKVYVYKPNNHLNNGFNYTITIG